MNSYEFQQNGFRQNEFTRREFVVTSAGLLMSLAGVGCAASSSTQAASGDGPVGAEQRRATNLAPNPKSTPNPNPTPNPTPYRISLAQWSLYREHFGDWARRGDFARFASLMSDPDSLLEGELDPLDFAATAAALGFEGIEYVNTFFYSKASNAAYLAQLKQRAEDAGVESLLIMCDALGSIGDPDRAARARALENHHPWVDAAAFLGCHSVRVNAQSAGSPDEQQKRVADGLRQLCEYADERGIGVLVENHGGLSSNAEWLSGVMARVDHPGVGTLPDFGNFLISERGVEPEEWYDRYRGVEELMPWAKAVSAKTYAFDEQGNETTIDFARMLRIVRDSGYEGWVGVEFEGPGDSREGILATRRLLERLRSELYV